MNSSSAFEFSTSTLLVIFGSGLAGRASRYETKYDFREGWREAEVLDVVQLPGSKDRTS